MLNSRWLAQTHLAYHDHRRLPLIFQGPGHGRCKQKALLSTAAGDKAQSGPRPDSERAQSQFQTERLGNYPRLFADFLVFYSVITILRIVGRKASGQGSGADYPPRRTDSQGRLMCSVNRSNHRGYRHERSNHPQARTSGLLVRSGHLSGAAGSLCHPRQSLIADPLPGCDPDLRPAHPAQQSLAGSSIQRGFLLGLDLDHFDLICHIAFDQPPLTRRERAGRLKQRGASGAGGQRQSRARGAGRLRGCLQLHAGLSKPCFTKPWPQPWPTPPEKHGTTVSTPSAEAW